MSQDHIEQFFRKTAEDPAILRAIEDHAKTPGHFAASACAIAKQHGFEFSVADADAWIKKRRLENNGELSDSNLEAVAGGRNKPYVQFN